jgi:glycosyltransferase involved in cell wall biosynthesis
MPRRVVIIETQIKQYRKRFLLELAARLRASDIELKVAYSDSNSSERERGDTIELDEGVGVKIPAVWLFGERLVLQHAWPLVRHADLVITEQSNKLAFNLVLLALSQLGMKRLAYWGHGRNRQATRPGLSETLKRKLVARVDWWFAYTDSVKAYLVEQGMRPDAITVVQNTIDTTELSDAIRALTPEERARTRRELGIADDAHVGLFCGALTPAKEPEFLIEAASMIRREVPGFELVVIGEGPRRAYVEEAAGEHSHVHCVGPAFGRERARYFAIADVFLMPTLVGLAAVDAFAAGLPLFTTSLPTHGPEIDYLRDGENGVISEHDVRAFASAVSVTLQDQARLDAMREAALATAARLTLPHMVSAFETGILRCLGEKR